MVGSGESVQGIFGLLTERACHVGVGCQRCGVALYFIGSPAWLEKIGALVLILIAGLVVVLSIRLPGATRFRRVVLLSLKQTLFFFEFLPTFYNIYVISFFLKFDFTIIIIIFDQLISS